MRTKEELLNELKHMNLSRETTEPKVSTSLLTTAAKYKCCVCFYIHTSDGDKTRQRITISLDSTTRHKAEQECGLFCAQCQEALHLSFISLNKHLLLDSMHRWIKALDKQERLEKNTIETMKYKMKVVNRYAEYNKGFALLSVEDITAVHINKFMQWAIDKGSSTGGSLSSEYIKSIHGMLFSFFNFAVNEGVIQVNPCIGTKVPFKTKNRTDETKKAWMDADEYKAFREELIDKHLDRLVEVCDLLIYTGMRREELLGLRWTDFNELEGKLEINNSRVQLGGTSSGVYREDLKNSSSHRIYGLTDKITKMLVGIKARQQELKIYEPSGYIFKEENKKSDRFGKEYRPEYFSKLFKKAIKSSVIISDKTLHLYSMRHSCCSLLFSLGYSLAEVQAWLGHKEDSKVTVRVYNHYKMQISTDRMHRLDNKIWG